MFRSALTGLKRYPFPASIRYYSRTARMSLKAISSKDAASLDKDLMEIGGWSLDQLMELAGLSVSQAGGDGLVAARHLAQYGYKPSVYYPKEGKNELYQRLKTQLDNLSVPFITDFPIAIKSADLLVDAIFGFSFGGPLRDPFPTIISQIEAASVPVLSVDAPSSWDIEGGPPKEGPGSKFMPEYLISLTAPKPCVKYYQGRHFLGGRFLTKSIAEKYGLDLPNYPDIDQIVEVRVDAEGRL
ncbi:AI-BP family protein [Aspergillus bombycis]|uniref:NAD(P)H-hydrate epimerase n=1 Tax=Aspergillus bombycis TaxID=109264 RepID=A0A1F7ZKK2_9EURO|nr:AI-BP family protein [Aspergillus bombycis]OGM39658.1 AI-BP family protein [Aspergillus bombycis]